MGGFISRASKHNNDDSPLHILHEELIQGEILPRLPVQSLVRFRCVCKSWKYLLSCNPVFIQSHISHSCMDPNNNSLISRCSPRKIHKYKFHPLKSRYLQLGGSVNGLVCVYHFNHHSDSITCLGIWNPATNQYKEVPLPPSSAATSIIPSEYCFGLGFDPVANDYKLVFIAIYPDRPLVAHVYSCNDSCWGANTVTSNFVARGNHDEPPTIVQGCPYWYNCDVKCMEHSYVMSFDIQHGVFRLLPGLKIVTFPTVKKILVNLRDSLAFVLCDFCFVVDPKSVDVYFFDEKCNLWTKNYTVEPIPAIPKTMYLTHCFKNGDILFHSTLGQNDLLLVSVHPETHTITKLETYVYDRSLYDLFLSYSFDYIESLVFVEGMKLMHVRNKGPDILIIERSF